MKIGIVANEPSGDLLGASIVRHLKARIPDASFIGVAGNVQGVDRRGHRCAQSPHALRWIVDA